jgi:hypothetical protein
VGGAATSGQGLSAGDIAHCIKTAAWRLAVEDREQIAAWTARIREHGGIVSADANTQSRVAGLPEECFRTMDKFTCTTPSGLVMHVQNYAPAVFEFLRGLESIDNEAYQREWTLDASEAKLTTGEGRSQAFFLHSQNRDFICKTIAPAEAVVLVDILADMSRHLTTYPSSLLCRFLGLLHVQEEETKAEGWLCIFTDVFATCPELHERWDLKGRKPKEGKGRQPPLVNEKTGQENETIRKYREQAMQSLRSGAFNPGSPQLDGTMTLDATMAGGQMQRMGANAAVGHFAHAGTMGTPRTQQRLATENGFATTTDAEAANLDATVSQDVGRILAKKDNALTRLFWFNRNEGAAVLEQLRVDAHFLAAHELMDYSTLIGVSYNDPSFTLLRPVDHPTTGPVPAERRSGRNTFQPTSRYQQGIVGLAGVETYHIGIIDMLTCYNMKKKTANFFKNFLWTNETLSTVPPEMYRDRFLKYLNRVIARADLENVDVSNGSITLRPAPTVV